MKHVGQHAQLRARTAVGRGHVPRATAGGCFAFVIFLLKPVIIGTIYAYERYEKPYEDAGGAAYANYKDLGGPDDEIAE